jgi:hypothetical protein
LLNLLDDPSEKQKNTAAEHPEIVARLRQLLHEARDTHHFTRPNASATTQ